jgi:hypothetical protein
MVRYGNVHAAVVAPARADQRLGADEDVIRPKLLPHRGRHQTEAAVHVLGGGVEEKLNKAEEEPVLRRRGSGAARDTR